MNICAQTHAHEAQTCAFAIKMPARTNSTLEATVVVVVVDFVVVDIVVFVVVNVGVVALLVVTGHIMFSCGQ